MGVVVPELETVPPKHLQGLLATDINPSTALAMMAATCSPTPLGWAIGTSLMAGDVLGLILVVGNAMVGPLVSNSTGLGVYLTHAKKKNALLLPSSQHLERSPVWCFVICFSTLLAQMVSFKLQGFFAALSRQKVWIACSVVARKSVSAVVDLLSQQTSQQPREVFSGRNGALTRRQSGQQPSCCPGV